jgi:hypothetical protein
MSRSANANANANLLETVRSHRRYNWRLTVNLTNLTNFSPFWRMHPVFPPFFDGFVFADFADIFAINKRFS